MEINEEEEMRMRARARRRRAEAAKAEAPPEAPRGRTQEEKDSTATIGNRLRTWGRGAMLGFQDEAEGMFAAMLPETEADRIARDITGGEKQGYWDEAAMRAADARASQKQYAEDNPYEATALEIGGAVMSPVNRIAPGIGTQGNALTRATQLAARGGVEGAVAGFGEGEGGLANRLDRAKTGAAWGGGLGGGLSLGGGYVGRKLSDERVTENLRNLKDQMPLHLADPEGSLGKFYRNVVGLAYGGGGKLGKQESSYLNKARRMARFADDTGEVVPVEAGTRRNVDDIKSTVRNETRARRDTIDRQIGEIRDTEIPSVTKPTQAQVNERVDEGLAASRAKLRQEQRDAALSPFAPDEVKVRVSEAETPIEALSELDAYWKGGDAFKGVKDHTYDLDDNLYNFLKRNLDPEVDANTLEALEEAFEAGDATISGNFLMEMRNRPAIGSGTRTGMGYGKARQSVKKWDNQIERQLKSSGNTPALKQFRADKKRYADYKAYENATQKAVNRKDIRGEFTEGDLWTSGGNQTQRNRGRAPGQARAREVIEESEGLSKTLRREADEAYEAAQQAKKAASGDKKKQISLLENAKRREAQRERAALNRINRETTGMLPEDSTFWSRAAATAGLGAPFAGLSVVGALPAGYAVSSALASPRVQRFMAGQGPMQDALREALEAGDTAVVTQILARIGALEGAEQEN